MAEILVSKRFVVSARNGLHIRPAEQLARLANRFSSKIELIYESQRVDAKSIMELLTLGASEGAGVAIEARGSDAQEAVDAVLALVEREFATSQEAPSPANESSS